MCPHPRVGIINGHDKQLKVIIYKMHTHTYGEGERKKKETAISLMLDSSCTR